MRIAVVHSFYRSDAPSGENLVVMRQAEALTKAGHEVSLVARHTDEESRVRLYPARAAFRVATGIGPDPTAELRAFRPDVVHLHNLFPNFGERWLDNWDGPLVATLHNFRHLCANGLLFRDGATCTDCVSGSSIQAVRHRCYRGSRTATLPLALHNAGGLARNRLIQRADRVIALSDRGRQVFASAGGEQLARKIAVIPNGIEDRSGDREAPQHWAFVGRLSPEKGIKELILGWPSGEKLVVVGDGPVKAELEASAPPDVSFTGSLTESGVDAVLRSSLGLMFPSRCFEGFPTVIAEALMHGTPVAARAGSSGADFVLEAGVGMIYESRPVLAMDAIREDRTELSTRARQVFVERLTVAEWCCALEREYQVALRGR